MSDPFLLKGPYKSTFFYYTVSGGTLNPTHSFTDSL